MPHSNHYKIHQLNSNELCGEFTSDILEKTLYVAIQRVINNMKIIELVSNDTKKNLDNVLSQITIRELKILDKNYGNYIVVDEYSLSYSYENKSIFLQSNYYANMICYDSYFVTVVTSELNKLLNGIKKTQNTCKPNVQQCKKQPVKQHETKNDVYSIQAPTIISSNVTKSLIIEDKQNTTSDNVDEIDDKLDILRKKMEKLIDVRDEQSDNNYSMKESIEKQRNKLDDFVLDKITEEKHKIKREEEKKEANRKVFRHDKKVYRLIKEDIENGKINEDDIPVLFESKYPIFEFMDSNDMITLNDEHDEHEFMSYCEFYDDAYPEIKEEQNKQSEYVPHNLHYLPEEEQKKYAAIKDKQTDIIGDFLERNTKQKMPEKEDSSYGSLDSDTDIFKNPEPQKVKVYASVDDILNQVDNQNDNNIKISLKSQVIEPINESTDLNLASVQNIKSDESRSSLAKALDK